MKRFQEEIWKRQEKIKHLEFKYRGISEQMQNVIGKLNQAEHRDKNLTQLNSLILQLNTSGFYKFLGEIMDLKKPLTCKKYYANLAMLWRTQKDEILLSKLRDPADSNSILFQREAINAILQKKYSEELSDGLKTKRIYPIFGVLIAPTEQEFGTAVEELATGKAISWDTLPDKILTIMKAVPEVKNAFFKLIEIGLRRQSFPLEIFVNRLMLLNKSPKEIPSIDNIRPIAINSVIQKIIEHIIYKRMQVSMKKLSENDETKGIHMD
jgi:hypothetical protein